MRHSRLWTWHIIAGIIILTLLGLHMLIMHLEALTPKALNPAGGEAVDWANVVARGKMAFFTVNYIVLLGAALFHGLYGLRNILFELGPGAGMKKALNLLLAAGGVALFVFGTWAAWTARAVAMASTL